MADRNSPWARAKAEIYGLQHTDRPGLGFYGIQVGMLIGIAWEVNSKIWSLEVEKTDSTRGAGSILLAMALFICYASTIWNLWPVAFSIFKYVKHYIQDTAMAAEFRWLSCGGIPWVYEMAFGILWACGTSFVWVAAKTDLQCLKSKNYTGFLLPTVAAWLDRIVTPLGVYDSVLNLLWVFVLCVSWLFRRWFTCNKWEAGAPAPGLVPAQVPAQLPPIPPPAVDEQLPHVPEVDVQALMELLTAFDRLACQTALQGQCKS